MSTPTFKAFGLLAPLALAGCVGGLDLPAALGGAEAPASVEVTSDAVVITGPRGFCVDPTSTRNDGDTGFVLLGNCAAISGRARAPQPDVAAVLTAAVSARSEGASLTQNLPALDAYFRSEQGRALLSRTAEPATVEILETRQSGEMFMLHARDTSAGTLGGVAQDYWRVYMDVGARVTTLSLLSLADHDVSDASALDTLMRFASAVQAANPGSGTTPGPASSAADLPQGGGQAAQGPFRTGLFQRIFR